MCSLALLFLISTIPGLIQNPPPPSATTPQANRIVRRLLDRWNRSKEYTIQVADKMPARGYAWHPRRADVTFGGQLLEAVHAVRSIADGISPQLRHQREHVVVESRGPYDASKHKDSMAIALPLVFEVMAQAIGTLTDGDLNNRIVVTPRGQMTALEAVLLAFSEIEYRRAQCIVYLTLKGIHVPDRQF